MSKSKWHEQDENLNKSHKKEPNENARTRIDVRCTVKQKKAIESVARKAGLSMSEFVLSTLFGKKVTFRVIDDNYEEV